MDDQTQKTIGFILFSLTPIITGAIGFFLKSILKNLNESQKQNIMLDKNVSLIHKDLDSLKEKIEGLSIIKDEWALIKNDLTKVLLEIDAMKSTKDDVVVIKRDMQSIWRNVDKIKDAMDIAQ